MNGDVSWGYNGDMQWICRYVIYIYIYVYPLVMTNIAKGNGPFIDGLHFKNGVFSMAMLNNQMVYIYICVSIWEKTTTIH